MSRPILSRPRTRVYGCNYDKGESYYKPMVDHLDRKYSGRPLFSEPRTSLADEIAARRSDIGSRNLSGRSGYYDDLDFIYDGRGRMIPEENFEDDFVLAQRRIKERAAAAFEEDLAELRRKRRDMQDRFFDVIDLNAEIEKARNTLETADIAFQKHATKFNNEEIENEDISLAQKIERTKKLASMDIIQERPKTKPFALKLSRLQNMEPDIPLPQTNKNRQMRIHSLTDATESIQDPIESLGPMKRRFLKRKKSVSF